MIMISPNDSNVFDLPAARITLADIDSAGLILDIDAGGEGVIGQLKPRKVLALDSSLRELEEAPCGSHKLVQNACAMGFPANTFDTAT